MAAKGDIQHHIGYAYHRLNDRRLMWIEYLEGRIEACRQRLRDSGRLAGKTTTAEPVASAQDEEVDTEEAEPEGEEATGEEESEEIHQGELW